MRKVDWNQYLSSKNPWTKRLLGLEAFSKQRNLVQIEREYNQDKYGALLNFDFTEIEAYKIKEFELAGITEIDPIFISIGEEIFETSLSLASSIYYSIILNTVQKYSPTRLCELGCGYGCNFSYLQTICSDVYGGEYAENAVSIAKKLGLKIKRFNYYEPDDYIFIQDKTTILTVHSIEQLPSAKSFIENLYQNREKLELVINFEPSLIKERTSFIGLLRNRYIEINDYNQDLTSLLFSGEYEVEILEYHPDYMGINPLNSTNIIVWRFR